MTNNLIRIVHEPKNKLLDGRAKRFDLIRLVYYVQLMARKRLCAAKFKVLLNSSKNMQYWSSKPRQ
jgi:hypothetical protein